MNNTYIALTAECKRKDGTIMEKYMSYGEKIKSVERKIAQEEEAKRKREREEERRRWEKERIQNMSDLERYGSFEQYLKKFRSNFFSTLVDAYDDGTWDQLLDLCNTDIEEANISNWFDSEEKLNQQYENIKGICASSISLTDIVNDILHLLDEIKQCGYNWLERKKKEYDAIPWFPDRSQIIELSRKVYTVYYIYNNLH